MGDQGAQLMVGTGGQHPAGEPAGIQVGGREGGAGGEPGQLRLQHLAIKGQIVGDQDRPGHRPVEGGGDVGKGGGGPERPGI